MSAATPVHAQIVLTLAHAAMPDHPRAKASQYFAEQVNAISQGRIVIDVLDRASLGDDSAMVQALLDGSLDISANSQGPIATVVPEYAVFGLPFLFGDPTQAWRVLDGPLGDELASRSEAKGLVVLGFWDNGVRHLSNSVRPIRKLADVAGLRIRVPNDQMTRDTLHALGATPQEVRFSELHAALQRGAVDGQENPLLNFQSVRLWDVQKFISLTGHKYEMTPFVMSRSSWLGLPPQDRLIIRQAAELATTYQRQLSLHFDSAAHMELLSRGVQISAVDTAPFIAATATVYDKWTAGPVGEYARRVIRAARGRP